MNPEDYAYLLPEKNIALEPSVPRDSSKLFVYDTALDKIILSTFSKLDKFLPDNSFLVMNDTKVLPARVMMTKETGGKVIVLFLVNETGKNTVPVIVDRKITPGTKLFFPDKKSLEIISQQENIFILRFEGVKEELYKALRLFGTMPIPPYLKKTTMKKDELMEKYQTVFARYEGSSAAPTASLHFTPGVFEKLEKKGIDKYFVTLHVGMGTFAPLTAENLNKKTLHEEFYEVRRDVFGEIQKLKSEGRKLVAVGTTVTRTLESAARSGRLTGKTDLFIYPPYDFKMADAMITNFHLPKSSLMMLVQAFLEYKKSKKSLMELYKNAIKEGFRFYSFGDAMLIK